MNLSLEGREGSHKIIPFPGSAISESKTEKGGVAGRGKSAESFRYEDIKNNELLFFLENQLQMIIIGEFMKKAKEKFGNDVARIMEEINPSIKAYGSWFRSIVKKGVLDKFLEEESIGEMDLEDLYKSTGLNAVNPEAYPWFKKIADSLFLEYLEYQEEINSRRAA